MTGGVAYLGPPGTFGEVAALTYAPTSELTPLPSHSHVVTAVLDGSFETGIAAIENSLEGPVTETQDALIRSDGVFIRGEIVVNIEHNLIVAPGTNASAISVVMSHPQALGQCRAYLERNLPGARLEAALSTAAAVQEAVKTPNAAAIGTRRASELAGGLILAPAIQDVSYNQTRFVVLSRSDAAPTGDDKTSLAFTVAHDRPGTLLGVLKELSDRSINLTRIESRPSREQLGVYVFLIDFQGHRTEPKVAEAIEAVRNLADYFRILGSYPRFL